MAKPNWSSEAQYRLSRYKREQVLNDTTKEGKDFLLGYLMEGSPEQVESALKAMRTHDQRINSPYYFKEKS